MFCTTKEEVDGHGRRISPVGKRYHNRQSLSCPVKTLLASYGWSAFLAIFTPNRNVARFAHARGKRELHLMQVTGTPTLGDVTRAGGYPRIACLQPLPKFLDVWVGVYVDEVQLPERRRTRVKKKKKECSEFGVRCEIQPN